jgi:hypothetical protein
MRPTAGLMPQAAVLVRLTARHCAAMGMEPQKPWRGAVAA